MVELCLRTMWHMACCTWYAFSTASSMAACGTSWKLTAREIQQRHLWSHHSIKWKEKLEVDKTNAHPKKNFQRHHPPGHVSEPTRKQEGNATEEDMEMFDRGRHEDSRDNMACSQQGSTELRVLESCCWSTVLYQACSQQGSTELRVLDSCCWSTVLYQESKGINPVSWPTGNFSTGNYCKVPCKRPPPLKHKFLRKVGGGRLLGILPFVQSIIQPLRVQVNTKRLEFKQKSYLFQF